MFLKTERRITKERMLDSRPNDKASLFKMLPKSEADNRRSAKGKEKMEEPAAGKSVRATKKSKTKMSEVFTDVGCDREDYERIFDQCLETAKKRSRHAMMQDDRFHAEMAVRFIVTTSADLVGDSKNYRRDFTGFIGSAILESCLVSKYRPALLLTEFGTVRWDLYHEILLPNLAKRTVIDSDGAAASCRKYTFVDQYSVPKERPVLGYNANLVSQLDRHQKVHKAVLSFDDDIDDVIKHVSKSNISKAKDGAEEVDVKVSKYLRKLVRVSVLVVGRRRSPLTDRLRASFSFDPGIGGERAQAPRQNARRSRRKDRSRAAPVQRARMVHVGRGPRRRGRRRLVGRLGRRRASKSQVGCQEKASGHGN